MNGDQHEIAAFDDPQTGKALVQALSTDDWGSAPNALVIEVVNNGRRIGISIPYSDSLTASTWVSKE